MRFMMIVIPKGYETAPADAMPDAETVGAMDKYNNELLKAGVCWRWTGCTRHRPARGSPFPAASLWSRTAPSRKRRKSSVAIG